MGIQNFLTEKDNEVDAFERYPELGNGRYILRPTKHLWKERNGVGTFLAFVEVMESSPIADGVAGFPNNTVGEVRCLKIWGFGHDEYHKRVMGALKGYLASVMGWDVKDKAKKWTTAAAQLCDNDGHPKVVEMLSKAAIKAQVVVRPGDPKNPKAHEWRLVSYL